MLNEAVAKNKRLLAFLRKAKRLSDIQEPITFFMTAVLKKAEERLLTQRYLDLRKVTSYTVDPVIPLDTASLK